MTYNTRERVTFSDPIPSPMRVSGLLHQPLSKRHNQLLQPTDVRAQMKDPNNNSRPSYLMANQIIPKALQFVCTCYTGILLLKEYRFGGEDQEQVY